MIYGKVLLTPFKAEIIFKRRCNFANSFTANYCYKQDDYLDNDNDLLSIYSKSIKEMNNS